MWWRSVRLLGIRVRNRGVGNTICLLRYHLNHFFRYTTFDKLINLFGIKVQRWLRVAKVRGMPYRYNIDPTNICNLRCPACPTGLGIIGRKQGKMDLELYKQIVGQIAKYAYVVELYNWGEPFLHPDIFDMIAYAHQNRISVRLSSNLNHFSPDLAKRTVASQLDRIIVSIDGSTQEVYEKYRRRGNLAQVLAHTKMLVEEKKRQNSIYPFILVRMLVHRYNEHQIEELRRIAENLGVDGFSTGGFFVDTMDPTQVEEWLPVDVAQSAYDYSASKLENVWNCADLWEGMIINWDGGIAPCCWVHRQEYDFANVKEKPLAEIWNDEAYVSSRRVFAFGASNRVLVKTVCTACRGKPLYLKE